MHISVLLKEAVQLLNVRPDGTYVDATAGLGGHSAEILKILGPQGKLILADCDVEAVSLLKEKFKNDGRSHVVQARFSELQKVLEQEKIVTIDGIIADLGISSSQLDDPRRGIGFMREGPLDMRIDPRLSSNAADFLENATEEEIADCIYQFGGERHSRKIARALVYQRNQSPLRTTGELRELSQRVLGRFYRKQKIHPATRVFQAIRIRVNRELEELSSLLEAIPSLLGSGGRAVIISFHSLEDRMVKRSFQALAAQGWNRLTKKPITPSLEEIKNNPRSRSAKMRGIEKD